MRRTDNSLPVVLVSDLAGSGSASEKQHVTKLERKRAWLVHMVGSLISEVTGTVFMLTLLLLRR